MSRDGWMKKKSLAGDDNGWAERGGYMAAKVAKLDEQFKLSAPREKHKEGTSSAIFSGIAIYVNGYTDPSADELRRLMMLHGGQFHVYYRRSKTTHIIANNLPNSKIQDLKGEKVIRPEWITDSIKAGRLLPYLQYQLYAKGKGVLFTGINVRQDTNIVDPFQALPQPNVSQNHFLPQHSKHSLNTYHKKIGPNHAKNYACLQPQFSSSVAQDKRLGHPQPQIKSLRCQNGVDIKINGHATTLLDTSHSALAANEDSSLNEVPLTNGHTRLNNGALKQEDLSPVTEPSDFYLLESKARGPDHKHFTSIGPHSKWDPYDFPHSPETQSGKDFELQDQHCVDALNKAEPKAIKITCCPSSQEPETSLNGDSCQENSCVSRLNGHYHNISDCSSVNKNDSFTEQTLSKSSELQAQTDNLISEFYSHSRLHQISTWRTAFSEYVNELHCKRKTSDTTSFSGVDRLRKMKGQGSCASQGSSVTVKSCIFHVDMDCFFVSVGIRHRPDLKGKPVAVTSNRGLGRVPLRPGANPQLEKNYYEGKLNHAQHRNEDEDLHRTPSQEIPDLHTNGVEQDATALSMAEIASCSYEARKAGVKNGMFFGKAKQLCPSLQSVPYDFEAYKQVALTMYETLASYTHDIEALSCDEVLIDATSMIRELKISPNDLASAIRADIKEKTGCCASVGMGSNILLARLATRRAKPNGQYFLKSEEVDDFIRDLAVTSLPGVGPAMGRKLAAMGVRSCGDLRQVSMSVLQKKFGPRTGQTLFRFCRGLDDRPVRYEKERKSVSAEMNYNIRFTRIDEAECFLTNLSMEVQKRLKAAGLRGRRVTLKVMIRKVGAPIEPAKYGGHGICDSIARTVMLAQSTDNGQLIALAVIKLFHAMKLQVQDLRGVGIQVQLLEGNNSVNPDSRSIKDLFTRQGLQAQCPKTGTGPTKENTTAMPQESSSAPASSVGAVSETSKRETLTTRHNPQSHRRLSIDVPSPSQVDRSVLEALPADLREQVEQSWTFREVKLNGDMSLNPQPSHPSPSDSTKPSPTASKIILQIPNQPENTGIVLELPNFSQIDPEVFAALPKELQDEIKSAYSRTTNQKEQASEVRNPLLQLKQAGVGPVRVKRQYKRKNNSSPAKNGPSPLKKRPLTNSPAKILPSPIKLGEPIDRLKTENSSSKQDIPQSAAVSRASPTLAGASEWTDIKTLLREWVTTITEPMEEDILQVVKYCTDLIEDKDLEKLDLVIKYMKRLMKLSVESVWSMAFDFIVDNVQVVLQQTYGSTLKLV
ncbi:DNA repair protein REV1 [Periophthalmus magnuspinnatus]|uniref:DNA repair protein REV1 n=1 Tax=Periophthalmus magnuspinnatus TaxID=409849 RepID=UPI0024371FF6|nr:DNA repair protein REV1 [Periophthalmus magnuspinnatus]